MIDLKDAILQTLNEIDDNEDIENSEAVVSNIPLNLESDKEFYKNLKERILVLFEGLQSPNMNNTEKKLDLTLNFLEYLLASLDKKIDK